MFACNERRESGVSGGAGREPGAGPRRELTFRNDASCLPDMTFTRSRSSTWPDSSNGKAGSGVPGSFLPNPSVPGLPPTGRYLAEGAVELPAAHDELGLLFADALQASQIPR